MALESVRATRAEGVGRNDASVAETNRRAQLRELVTEARLAAVALSLCSGAALLAAILAHFSLPLVYLLLAGFSTVVLWAGASRLPRRARRILARRALMGLGIGLAATAAYDLVRLFLVDALALRVHPFDTFRIFGELITGRSDGPLPWAVGTGYHYLNGMSFAAAYAVTVGGRTWTWGLVWALALESLMLGVYPGWLHIRQIYIQEFTLVSMSGHLAYGLTLGLVGSRLLVPLPWRIRAPNRV